MEWPRIDDQPADVLAQIDCTDLPPDLWGGLGPREGALAFFLHRRKPAVRVLHLRDPGIPVQPPFALNDAEGWFGPHGGLGQIGSAHVCTPVTNAHLVCRLLLATKNR